jgi:hypothetical protein
MNYIFFKKIAYTAIVLGAVLFVPVSLKAAMTGGDFNIYGDVFSSFEDSFSTGGDFKLFETGGGSEAGSSSGGTFILNAGFQALEQGTASLTLSTATVDLGELSASSVSTATVTTTITVDSTTGYALAIAESGDLLSGANDIDDVADGTVTAGSEEYGIKTTGGDGQLVTDTAITGASLTVASSAGAVQSMDTPILFSVSVDTTKTRQGSYSHVATFTLTANP